MILNSFIEEKSIKLSLHKPSYDHWYTFKLGSSKYHLTINLLDVENRIRIALWINNDKETYDKLFTNKDKIESIYGEKLEWDRKDSRKASWVADYLSDFSYDNQENWPELQEKVISKILDLQKALKPFLK